MSTSLAERLAAVMAERNTNQFRLAKDAGLHQDGVRNILRGKSKSPGVRALHSIANVLGVSPEWLLCGDKEPSEEAGRQPPNPAAQARAAGNAGGNGGNRAAEQAITVPRAGVSTLPSTPPGRVTLNINATVSMGTAARILAMIEEDQP